MLQTNNSQHSITDWTEFLDSQIQLEEHKRNRYGITAWILLACLATLGNKFVSLIFTIKMTPDTVFSIRLLSLSIFICLATAAFFLIDNYELFSLCSGINTRILDGPKNASIKIVIHLLYFLTISRIWIEIFKMDFDKLFPSDFHRFTFILCLILATITSFLKLETKKILLSNSFFKRENSIKGNIQFCWTMLICLIFKYRKGITLHNNIIWLLLSTMFIVLLTTTKLIFNYDIALFSILLNLIIIIIFYLVNLYYSYCNQSYYESLKKELFLTNDISEDQMKKIVQNISGIPFLDSVNNYYNKILNFDTIIENKQYSNDKEFHKIISDLVESSAVIIAYIDLLYPVISSYEVDKCAIIINNINKIVAKYKI